MSEAIRYAIQTQDFDLNSEYQRLRRSHPDAGAITTFTGLVREFAEPSLMVNCLELQTYPALAKEQVKALADTVFARFDLLGVSIIHRYGPLQPREQIVFVGVASKHRHDSFAAAEMLMDHLKSRVAFWKKEQCHNTEDGEARWINVKQGDLEAVKRWE